MAMEWEADDVQRLEEKRYISQLEASNILFEERIAELEFAQEDWGWTRLGGEAQYEFSRDHLRRMIARSRLFFLQNPLINRAVSLYTDYVWAQGVSIQATNDDVNAAVQEFMDDVSNQREFTSHNSRLLKEQTLIVDGPARCQIKITDAFSIDITFIHSMRSNVGGCGPNFFPCFEFFSEQRRRSVKRILREPLFDPFCFPIRDVQQCHLPKSRLAPRGRLTCVIPNLYLP